MHSNATNTALVARETLAEPIISEIWEAQLNRKKVGPKFKTDLKALEELIKGMNQLELEEGSKVLNEKGEIDFKLPGKEDPLVVTKDDMTIERVTKKQNGMSPPYGIA